MQVLTRSNLNRYRLRLLAVALVAALGLVAAAVAMAGAKHSTSTASTATVSTRKISGLGVVLVNAKGRTLYGLSLTKAAIRKCQFVVLVEGYFDFAQVFQSEAAPVVASCGTALTPQQAHLLRRFTSKVRGVWASPSRPPAWWVTGSTPISPER